MLKGWELETPPHGAGFDTSTCATPALASGFWHECTVVGTPGLQGSFSLAANLESRRAPPYNSSTEGTICAGIHGIDGDRCPAWT
jgi:hypothetical protein